MSQELLFTSAPKGLNPSDQGFCTVVCTEGMPRNLKEFLESLSGYRQADLPPHPVNFSHLIHSVGGKRYHVLSRVSDYHKDYSGRTNKLAHHVALTTDELPASGPAALLGTSLFLSAWDGQTRSVPRGPALPPAAASQGPCRTWEALTGDAGWAGLLAEASADGSNRPMYVIFAPGQNVLPLVSEALGILPREKAWSTSFSTYYAKLPAGVDCLWRFVLDGSPEAVQARAASHSRTIDLVELQNVRRRAPQGNPYVEAARAGRMVESPQAGPGSFARSAAHFPTASASAVSESAAPPRPFTPSTAPDRLFTRRNEAGQKSPKLPIILGGAALALLAGALGLVYSMMTRDLPPQEIASASKDRERKTRNLPAPDEADFESPVDKARREAAERRAAERKTEPPIKIEQRPEKTNSLEAPQAPKITIQGPWDRTLATLDGDLILPPRNQTVGVITKPEATLLAEIHVADPKEIDLTLTSSKGSSADIGREDSDTEGLMIQAENEESETGRTSRRWIVKRKVIDQFTKLPKHTEVATFALADQNLSFVWNMDAPDWAKANSLQYCVLEISNSGQSRRFRLSKPKSVPRERYKLEGRDHKIFLAVNPNAIDDPDDLTLDLQLHGVGPEAFSKPELHVGDTATFSAEAEGIHSGNRRVEFDLTFEYDGKRPYIEVNAYTFRKVLTRTNSRQEKEELKALGQFREMAHTIPLEELRLSTIVSDFERIAERSVDIEKALSTSRTLTRLEKVEIPKTRDWLDMLNNDLGEAAEAGDAKRQAQIEKDIRAVQNILDEYTRTADGYHERIDLIGSHVPWTQAMQPYFEKLAQTAQVGYSLYITINGEKVFLAQTQSAESGSQKKSQGERMGDPAAKDPPKAGP